MEEQHQNFVVAIGKWEMLAATNQMQGKNERQWKKVNENTYDISSIKSVTKKFLEASRCSRAKQRQRNVQKRVLHVQSSFLLIRDLLLFFTVLRRCLRRLALHDFIFCLNEL